jgi:hypothetical protein
MMQMDLVLPLARHTDPDVSHKAAIRATKIAPSHRNLIMAALREHPGTVYSLESRIGLDAHRIGKRLIELQRLGLAEPTGEVIDGCRQWRAK